MKRTILVSAFLAMGLLVANVSAGQEVTPAAKASQEPTAPSTKGGQVSIGVFSSPDVASSKFQEYREVPNGAAMPFLNLYSTNNTLDFNLRAQNVFQKDQRYNGFANLRWLGVSFDYNQTPHNMGNGGLTLLTETAPGVWTMNSTLRQQLGTTAEAMSSAGRTYPFYANLLAPTVAAANSIDLYGARKRGQVEFDLGKQLPFDLAFTYQREVKTGTRGASGGDILGTVTSAIDVGEPMNEVVQDYGFRWAYNLPQVNLHATFNRNLYNDRIDALIIDNPFRTIDAASGGAGPAQARFSTAPDNQASRGAFGAQVKLAHQTRIGADFAIGRWTQDAQFLPFTINSAITSAPGVFANSLSVLPQQSLAGQINTTMANLSFSSRPVRGLGVRMHYRSYDMANKTAGIPWNLGSTSGNPDRTWGTEPVSEEAPFGFATANPYSSKSQRFDVQGSYDIKDLTFEVGGRKTSLDRTYREAASGTEDGYSLAAVYHAQEWVRFRAFQNYLHRTAKGTPDPATFIGYQADEAERKQNRAGFDLEVNPSSVIGFTFAYARRHDDYPNRPQRSVNVPAYITSSNLAAGLLSANYDEYTAEVDITPAGRAEVNFFYSYEKNTTENQRIAGSSFSSNVTDLYRWVGLDKGNTYGANAIFHIVPEVWTFSLNAQHQKVDGFLDTQFQVNPAGTYFTGRAALGGVQPVNQYDDTKWTTFLAQLDRTIAKAWTISFGYTYEKYDFGDAFDTANSSTSPYFPQSVLFFMNANDGAYKASVGFAKLSYKF